MSEIEKSKKVEIMVPDKGVHQRPECRDAGENYRSMGASNDPVLKQNIDSETLAVNINKSLDQFGEMLSRVGPVVGETWEIKSVSVGLRINMDGSVGIAASGTESSLQVKLIPRRKTEDLGF